MDMKAYQFKDKLSESQLRTVQRAGEAARCGGCRGTGQAGGAGKCGLDEGTP